MSIDQFLSQQSRELEKKCTTKNEFQAALAKHHDMKMLCQYGW
jgi:hypothetical protein